MLSYSLSSLTLLLVGGLLLVAPGYAQLRLNEAASVSEAAIFTDEDGDVEDWIELYNAGGVTVDLTGYRLTDDATDMAKWTFPQRSLAPGDYLIVVASGKTNRPAASSELHANFKLAAGGEYLGLIDPAGNVIDEFTPEIPALEAGQSYGYAPTGNAVGIFGDPTPGSMNGAFAAGVVADTNFDPPRGIYGGSQTITITSETPGATIRYTLDGSEPTLSNGTTYDGPIVLNKTTTVRAAAFKSGLTPTNIDTHSYLMPSDIVTQNANGARPPGWPSFAINGQIYDYGMDPQITSTVSAQEMEDALKAIPSVMLTLPIEALTSSTAGIYSNPNERGRAWEREASMEILSATPGTVQLSARCGLRIRGGFSRSESNPKHAFRVFFREEYGDRQLEFPIFGPEGAEDFEKIDFRTAQNYSWAFFGDAGQNTFLREVLARDLQRESGQPYTRSRYYHLYLNGIYWGLYMSQERAEAEHASRYFRGSSGDFDTIKSGGRSQDYNTEATDGTLTGDWRTLWNLARSYNATGNESTYLRMQGLNPDGSRNTAFPVLLDVDNLIDYMLIIGYTGSYDSALSDFVGASNNWFGIRNRERDDRGFAFFLHDAEHSMGAGPKWNDANDRINTDNAANRRGDFAKSNPQFLHFDIAERSADYRLRFADRAHAALFNGGYLDTPSVLATVAEREQVVDEVIIAESARWGDAKRSNPATRQNWLNAVSSMKSTINGRKQAFLGHLRTGGLYPQTDAPAFSPGGGFEQAGAMVGIAADSGTIYYTLDRSDPRAASGAPSGSALSVEASGLSQVLIPPGASGWRYEDSGANLGSSTIVAGASGYSTSHWKHPDYNDNSWDTGTAVFGHGELGNDSVQLGVTTTVGLALGGGQKPITSYFRRDFDVADVAAVASLTAAMVVDDGAIVYVNGVEVNRDNLPDGNVGFETTADNAVFGSGEVNYDTFSIPISVLVDGQNTIGVEVHQAGAGSSDLGFDLTLTATLAGQGAVTITEPTWVYARVLDDGEWSALNKHYYSTGSEPQPGELVISELHYNPREPSAGEIAVSTSRSDYEFIELANISTRDLELRGLTLAEQLIGDHLEGVRFDFEDGMVLPPGAKVVIVANRDAFIARYPSVDPFAIAGEFDGNLGNSGEWLEVRTSSGSLLSQFRYNDKSPWPTDADGEGASLKRVSLSSAGNDGDALSWFAGTVDGDPGDDFSVLFAGGAEVDLDSDGQPALLEYFAGTSEATPGGGPALEVALVTLVDGDKVEISYERDPNALGVTFALQTTGVLDGSWEPVSSGVALVERLPLPGGRVRETLRLDGVPTSEGRLFVQLLVTRQ